MKSIDRIRLAAAVCAAFLLPQAAIADYGDTGSLKMSNYAYPSALTFSVTGHGNVGAGGFSATYDANGSAPPAPTSFVAYCIDLAQTFGWNSAFNVTETNPTALFSVNAVSMLDRLYTQHFAEATTASKSAAFQLAVWEIITETSGSYSLSGGTFAASGDATAIGTANTWFSTLTSASGGYHLTALVGPNNQDQMMATPVPEPETYAMLLAGLGLMAFVARRRQRELALPA